MENCHARMWLTLDKLTRTSRSRMYNYQVPIKRAKPLPTIYLNIAKDNRGRPASNVWVLPQRLRRLTTLWRLLLLWLLRIMRFHDHFFNIYLISMLLLAFKIISLCENILNFQLLYADVGTFSCLRKSFENSTSDLSWTQLVGLLEVFWQHQIHCILPQNRRCNLCRQ